MSKKQDNKEGIKPEGLTQESVLQLQLVEQAMQNVLVQKQALQIELMETSNALEELKKAKQDDVYKIVGSLMFKSNRQELEKELERKRDIINLRLKTLDKQEQELKDKLIGHRNELLKTLKK